MENCPKVVEEVGIQVQESESPKKDEPKEATLRHIKIKKPKFKDRKT